MATAAAIIKVKPGDVVTLRKGLHVYHTQGQAVTVLDTEVPAVVENVRTTVVGSEDDHFEECYMVEARALNLDGSYHPEGALMLFAQSGDFRPEFIQSDLPVLRRMRKTYTPA